MTTAQATINKAAFSWLHDAANSGDPDAVTKAIDEIVADDLRFHAPLPMGATGIQALKQVYTLLLGAFPDLRVSVEDMIAEGDKLVIRNTVTGTHLGDFRGLPATGKAVRYAEMFVFRFADGRVAEIWGVVDALTQLRQLGAIPAGPA
jgi:steroid delta-isomerase-like uncharacterized protein